MYFKGAAKELPKATRKRDSAVETLKEWPKVKQDLTANNMKKGDATGFVLSDADMIKAGIKTRPAIKLHLSKFLARHGLTEQFEIHSYKNGSLHYIIAERL